MRKVTPKAFSEEKKKKKTDSSPRGLNINVQTQHRGTLKKKKLIVREVRKAGEKKTLPALLKQCAGLLHRHRITNREEGGKEKPMIRKKNLLFVAVLEYRLAPPDEHR